MKATITIDMLAPADTKNEFFNHKVRKEDTKAANFFLMAMRLLIVDKIQWSNVIRQNIGSRNLKISETLVHPLWLIEIFA